MAREKMHHQAPLEAGDLRPSVNKPIIDLVPGGKRAYLWIGNNAAHDKACYATLSGATTLRKLANAILAELDGTKGRLR